MINSKELMIPVNHGEETKVWIVRSVYRNSDGREVLCLFADIDETGSNEYLLDNDKFSIRSLLSPKNIHYCVYDCVDFLSSDGEKLDGKIVGIEFDVKACSLVFKIEYYFGKKMMKYVCDVPACKIIGISEIGLKLRKIAEKESDIKRIVRYIGRATEGSSVQQIEDMLDKIKKIIKDNSKYYPE